MKRGISTAMIGQNQGEDEDAGVGCIDDYCVDREASLS